jgi:glycosyltransferase involved in cell wall biosynthesis
MIGEYRFPDGDAAAIRTMSLARAFRDLGLTVTVLGKGTVRQQDFVPELGGYFVDGIRYLTMNPEPVSAWRRMLEPLKRTRLFATSLESLDLKDCVAVVINACDSARHVPIVQQFCRRNSIPLIGDICEWYAPRQMRGGWLNPFYLIFVAVFHFCLPRLRNVIVVSRLLEMRFADDGRTVVRVPSPIDPNEIPHEDRTPDDRLVLLYAGSAGRKDLLLEVLVALASLTPDERARVEFRLLGPTREDLRALLGGRDALLQLLGDAVKPLGRVPRRDVLAELQAAHFTVLVRPDLRYARAGFPSKVPESLAAGTPVLLNLTGDLGDFLADETAAIVVEDASPAGLAAAIRRALRLNKDEHRQLRLSARRKAVEHFDYRMSLPALSDLLNSLR